VYDKLSGEFRTHWEKSGSIGKRYARNDEVGTRYCITIDYDTMEDDSVTIRDVESTEQIRVSIEEADSILRKLIDGEKTFQSYLER
ncbi:MAG: His/Gly/Thr/Pro-type tRNA ligase C-terminal domain-containing protein, partial [Candidatus Aenigmatarchaeota archaeon]